MQHRIHIPLIVGGLVASALGLAMAAPQRSGPPAARPAVDANGDGIVTRAEAAAHPRLAQRFDQLDADKDGRLTGAERPQPGMHGGRGGAAQGRRGAAVGQRRLDADGDGRITRAEAAARPPFAQRFDAMDMNKDGVIDQADRAARHAQRSAECFAKADADRNGQLSRAEFSAVREVCGRGGGQRGR